MNTVCTCCFHILSFIVALHALPVLLIADLCNSSVDCSTWLRKFLTYYRYACSYLLCFVVSFQTYLLVWKWVSQLTNYIHLCPDRLLLSTGYFTPGWPQHHIWWGMLRTPMNEWSDLWLKIAMQPSVNLLAVGFWNFVSERVSLNLWLTGI